MRKIVVKEEPRKQREVILRKDSGEYVGTYGSAALAAEKLDVGTAAVSRALSTSGKIKGHTVEYATEAREFVRKAPSMSMVIPRGVFGADLTKYRK